MGVSYRECGVKPTPWYVGAAGKRFQSACGEPAPHSVGSAYAMPKRSKNRTRAAQPPILKSPILKIWVIIVGVVCSQHTE
jgi:hypothetical protein